MVSYVNLTSSVLIFTPYMAVACTKHQPAASHWQTLSHNVVSSTSRLGGIQTSVVIGTGYKGSCKSNSSKWFVFFIFTGKIYARGVETINWGNTFYIWFWFPQCRGRRDRDRKVVGFTTTFVTSAYHHTCFVSNPTIKIKYREKRWKFLLNLLHLQWIA
jgi:hypothetical protein